MQIIIDHKLRIARSELPTDVEELIVEALTIPNMDRQHRMEHGIPGWQRLPKTISFYKIDNQQLVMPRGFKAALFSGLNNLGIRFDLIDERTYEIFGGNWRAPLQTTLHPWQGAAIQVLCEARDGIWKAPAGSGKTVGILGAIAFLRCSAIVIVNTLDILRQWQDRAKQFLGEDFPVSLIGGGKFEVSDCLTIATAQTLNSRYEELESTGFFDQFSFMCLDECHHATAETYSKVVSRFSSLFRVGVSATPDKTGDFALAQAVLGPIVHETAKEQVTTIIKPSVFRIPTDFAFSYVGRLGNRPSNYPDLVQELVVDSRRNSLIVASILLNQNRHILVCSRRLDHLSIIGKALKIFNYQGTILYLTGNESQTERETVIWIAERQPCVLLSTLADEAIDIPRLDALFLVFPQRNIGLIEQQIGRISRKHEDKKDAIVFDFCDPLVGPLDAQWQVRRRDVYQKHGYEISTVLPKEIYEAINDYEEIERRDK